MGILITKISYSMSHLTRLCSMCQITSRNNAQLVTSFVPVYLQHVYSPFHVIASAILILVTQEDSSSVYLDVIQIDKNLVKGYIQEHPRKKI